MSDPVRWWAIRPAQNLSAAVYRCPLCGGRLPALLDHMLLVPEGDPARRRHAHTECVLEARRDGRLPTFDEWRSSHSASDRRRTWRERFRRK